MPQRLWSISQLARELGHNPRTVTKALAGIRADGEIRTGLPGWTLKTAVSAMRVYTENSPQLTDRGGIGAAPSCTEADITRAEDAAFALEELFETLRSEPDISKRRKIARRDGHLFGEFDQAFETVLAGDPMAVIHRPFKREVMANALAELLRLCRWEVEQGNGSEVPA